MSETRQRTVLARWEGGLRSTVEAGGFAVVSDEPESVGGSGTGPQPTELFLASVASCFVLSLAWVARKQGVELPEGLRVEVTGVYDGTRFSRLGIEVCTTDPEAVGGLLPRAEEVCFVSNTLRRSPELAVTVTAG